MTIYFEGKSYKYSAVDREVLHFFEKNQFDELSTTYVGFYRAKNGNIFYFFPFGFETYEHQHNLNNHFLEGWPLLVQRMIYRYRTRLKSTSSNNIVEVKTSYIQTAKSHAQSTGLDIILNLIELHTEHPYLYVHAKETDLTHKKINWGKTIKKSLPFIQDNDPVYMYTYGKNKVLSRDFTLYEVFYSTLALIRDHYEFSIDLIEGLPINKKLVANGHKVLKVLQGLRGKLFSDMHLRILDLLILFYRNQPSFCQLHLHKSEFLMIKKFAPLFENMLDFIISDPMIPKHFKDQKDGKMIDLLHMDKSFLNNNYKIFYVGDAKYYRAGPETLDKKSKYKQSTYARNILNACVEDIQNLNSNSKYSHIWDLENRSYHPIPSYFVFPYTAEDGGIFIFDNETIPFSFYHYENTLFDRDTFYALYFKIDLKYLMDCYVKKSQLGAIRDVFREIIKNKMSEFYKDKFSGPHACTMDQQSCCNAGHVFRLGDQLYFSSIKQIPNLSGSST